VLTELSYIGSRPYIRGADLYAWFDRQIGPSLPDARRPVTIRQLRLVREVERDGAWSNGALSGASATLDVIDRAGESGRFSFCETGAVISRRSPDIPSNVRELSHSGDFAGRAVLVTPVDMMDMLNGVIEANKRLHTETLAGRGVPADRIRLIFIENMPIGGSAGGDCVVEFRHLGERKAPDRTYTLNALRLGNGPANVRICYSY